MFVFKSTFSRDDVRRVAEKRNYNAPEASSVKQLSAGSKRALQSVQLSSVDLDKAAANVATWLAKSR